MEKPILLDFPTSFETERLIIRSPRPGDGAAFNAACLDSLTELRHWLGFYPDGPPSLEDSEILMRQKHAEFMSRTDLMLLLQLKDSATLVGSSGLHPRNWKVPSFEIGYWLRTPYSGQGYMTEAVEGITRFAFATLQAKRVQIRCFHHNRRSAAVARRAGYTLEARMINATVDHQGRTADDLLFARSVIHPQL